MDYSSKTAVMQEKSPLDPENFVDFKLKKIVPYNHNTAKCVQFVPMEYRLIEFLIVMEGSSLSCQIMKRLCCL
jgi:hypothetical protein